MKKDILLNQKELFSKYFEDGLKIRAICDDLDFPADYSPVLVNIHIRGPEHYINPDLSKTVIEQVHEMMGPESQKNLTVSRIIEDNQVKSTMSDILNGENLKHADTYLNENNNIKNFFGNQIDNVNKLYTDSEYRKKMIKIYKNNVKKLLNKYDEKKVKNAFKRGKELNNFNFN